MHLLLGCVYLLLWCSGPFLNLHSESVCLSFSWFSVTQSSCVPTLKTAFVVPLCSLLPPSHGRCLRLPHPAAHHGYNAHIISNSVGSSSSASSYFSVILSVQDLLLCEETPPYLTVVTGMFYFHADVSFNWHNEVSFSFLLTRPPCYHTPKNKQPVCSVLWSVSEQFAFNTQLCQLLLVNPSHREINACILLMRCASTLSWSYIN